MHTKRRSIAPICVLSGALVGVALSMPAAATTEAKPTLSSCRVIADASERLRCYDSIDASAPVTLASPFAAMKPPPPVEVTMRIERFTQRSDGLWLLELHDVATGATQRWLSTESGNQAALLREGEHVRIRRGAFGGFLLTAASGRSLRVRLLP